MRIGNYSMMPFKVDIFEAAFSGNIRRVSELLAANSELAKEIDSVDSQTPLHKAAMNGSVECVKLLLDNGADVNSVDCCGCTALHYAAANGYVAVARYMIRHGQANTKVKSNKGYMPIHMARRRGQLKMIAFLTEHDSDNNVPTTTINGSA